MEDGIQEDKRYRSPSFNTDEVKQLLNLIEKYKLFILNKSTTGAASKAKVKAWNIIAKQYNRAGFEHFRSAENLKLKWHNLKKEVRKMSRNLMDPEFDGMNQHHSRIASLLAEADNIDGIDAPPNDDDGTAEVPKDSSHNMDKIDSDDDDQGEEKRKRYRTSNYSPRECRLLLQCVKKEKQILFSKECTSNILEMKNQAWARVTDSYNRLSPQKRSTEMLKNKFKNIKKMVTKIGSKKYFRQPKSESNYKLMNGDVKLIKQEVCDEKSEEDSETGIDTDDVDLSRKPHHNYVELDPDPLGSVLNGDSGIGSSHAGTWNWDGCENKDIVKMKKDLLSYQMETAKLERKRIEDLIAEDAIRKQASATETALRLRAARLEAVAASLKFPPAHPALDFTPEESKAQYVLNQYQQN